MTRSGMKIVILTQYYPPDPPGWIPVVIAEELKRRGHDVRVLTTHPHYVNGRIDKGFKQKRRDIEDQDGILVRRVPIIPSHSRNPLGRIVNYLSFAWSAGRARDFVDGSDVIFVHGTPATVAAPANAWAKSLGIPFVYHVQDIWPESVTGSGFLPSPVAKLATKAINRWLSDVYRRAAAVNTIAPTAQRMLIDRGVPSEKSHLIFNWSYGDGVQEPDTRRTQPPDAGLTVIFAGTLGTLQDLDTVVRAASSVRDLEGFRLYIAGEGLAGADLRRLVSDLGATDTIRFLGLLGDEEMTNLYAKADFQVVSLKDLDIFAGTIPSKFQAGLAHGIPVITTVRGDVTEMVDSHGLGFSAKPEDVASLATAFRRAHATSVSERQVLSRRARQFYDEHFSKQRAVDRVESVLRMAVEQAEHQL